jgi:hypothetical protein
VENSDFASVKAHENTSAFARVGAKLVDQGFSPIPILSGTKRPPFNDWSRYCDRSATEIELGVWTKHDYGIGVACGFGGLCAIDIDTDDGRIISAVESVLPSALVAKRGRRGFTFFYRAPEMVRTRAFNIDGKRVVDILFEGRQSVIPPTCHPATGRAYVWTTPLALDDVSPEHLEMLPADVEERIGEALTPFGYQRPEPKREYDYRDFCGDVHDRAMTNFDDWVPSLGIPVFRSANGKYRGVATWRGGKNYNVGFSPQGIKDWVSEEGFSPSGLVERALGIDSWDSDNWLREKLGLPLLQKVVLTFRKAGDRQKALGVSASDLLDKDVGAPEFVVDGWLQNRKVGLLLGEDGAGKSFLLLDLAIAVATGSPWLGIPTVRAPVLLVSAEEEERDIKKRLQVALTHGLSARTGNLHIIGVDTIDQDYGGAVLAEVDEKTRKISMTKLWDAVVRKVESVNPKLLILEPLNELFDGDEMVRRQARQFIDNLRRLARKRDMPVLLGAHPSNASMNERRPGAGTNGWNAAVRMRWWLEVIRDNGDATNERKLHRMKVTGARNDRVPIDLVVGEGGWLVLKDGPKVEAEEGGLGAVLAKIERDKLAFMDAIEKRFALGVFLTASPASPKGYAPRAIVNDEGGRDRAARIKANERIMGDLLTEGRIASKQYGPKSKDKWRLEVVSRTPPLHSEKENKDDEHKD